MNFDLLFLLANVAVIPPWFLLIVFPKSGATRFVVQSYFYPILLGILYLCLLLISIGGEGGMGSLEQLKMGFSRDEVLVLGWVHYLVFDLFVGAWIARDATTHSIAHLKIIPSLLLTLFAGPVGLLSYLIVRGAMIRKWWL